MTQQLYCQHIHGRAEEGPGQTVYQRSLQHHSQGAERENDPSITDR